MELEKEVYTMMKFIMYIAYCFISFFCVYKWIRHIDKKERKYLKAWEKEYVSAYAEIWKEQYFLRLAEEKKLNEVKKLKEKEVKEQKEKLKEIHIENIEEFTLEYNENIEKATEKLEIEEEQDL